MPRPKPVPLKLSEAERTELERLVKRHTVSQQIALRGRIIQAAAAGKNNSQIAKELQVGRQMVRVWRERWLHLQAITLSDLSVEERLEDLPRPGAPLQITADQRCQIEALACEKPEGSERPISHWTAREIADEIMKRGIVADFAAPRRTSFKKRPI
jgi:putative transposase